MVERIQTQNRVKQEHVLCLDPLRQLGIIDLNGNVA